MPAESSGETVGGGQLSRCVGEVAPFLQRFWAREPMHRRSADRDGFEDLLTMPASMN
jgi:hypothetical protein